MMHFTETEALRGLEILMQMIPGFQPKDVYKRQV